VHLELTDQGAAGVLTLQDGSKIRAVFPSGVRLTFESSRGLPDIRFLVPVQVQQLVSLALCPEPNDEVVETRRLELLTLSLQRRCSSD
jgi:hypothetical protein